MSLHEDLKSRVNASMLCGDTQTRDTIRTVIGEAQMEALRRKGEVADEVVLGVVKRSVAGLKETIPLTKKDGVDTAQQEVELALLESILPKVWDRDAIEVAVAPHRDELRAA